MDEIIDQLALASAAVILYPPFFFYTKRGARLHSNLFVMYALPSVIYIVLVSVLIFGGGAAQILLGIPLLAFGFALSEHRISFTIIFIPARAWSGWLGSANGLVPVLRC